MNNTGFVGLGMMGQTHDGATCLVWVNTYRAVSFMPPFGGYRRSGLGRESGQEAINKFLQTKSVWISLADKVSKLFVLR